MLLLAPWKTQQVHSWTGLGARKASEMASRSANMTAAAEVKPANAAVAATAAIEIQAAAAMRTRSRLACGMALQAKFHVSSSAWAAEHQTKKPLGQTPSVSDQMCPRRRLHGHPN